MVNDRFEMKLPDGTKLIAETERNIDYPTISISYVDAEKNYETVAFAEYNPEKPLGQRLCAGIYQNHEEEPKFYDSFCYCIKPSFKELEELYNKQQKYIYGIYNGYVEIRDGNDFNVVYREFYFKDKTNHTGHNIELSSYTDEDGVVNYSFECMDCNEVIYSVDAPCNSEIDDTLVKFKIKDIKDEECYKNPDITYLDDIEDECWKLFKAYASYVGVEFGEGIDHSIAKELSEKFMIVVERVFGIPFPKSKTM